MDFDTYNYRTVEFFSVILNGIYKSVYAIKKKMFF